MQQRASREAVISVLSVKEMMLLGKKRRHCFRILMTKCNGVKIIEEGNNSLQKFAENMGDWYRVWTIYEYIINNICIGRSLVELLELA